jgi:hypothetical protein
MDSDAMDVGAVHRLGGFTRFGVAVEWPASLAEWNQRAESGVLFCKDMEAQDAN